MHNTERHQVRPEIELAWHRASLSGLDPGMPVRETNITDVDRRSRLSTAARPVLDAMMDELADTGFSVLLADRTSTIIDRRTGNRGLSKALDNVMAVPGSKYLEEISGTNSLATAFELRRPIAVTGAEHFLEALRVFCCYGAPIIHPVTHRLEGVLDVSGPVADATALLGPFLMRAIHDVEQRLLDGSRLAEQNLLAEFQNHAQDKRHAILVLGENLVLSNPAAVDLIKSVDHALLRTLLPDIGPRHPVNRLTRLSSGREVIVRAHAVADSSGGVLFEIERTPPPAPPRQTHKARRTATETAGSIAGPGRTVIVGEPGTGRTTAGKEAAGAGAVLFDAADAQAQALDWMAAVRLALETDDAVLIDNIHLLSPRCAATLTSAVGNSQGAVVMTTSPLTGDDFEHAALAAHALAVVTLRPVRLLQDDFAILVESVLRSLQPDSTLGISASALLLLAGQPWPANMRELRAVLIAAAHGRVCGDIVDSDLPMSYRALGSKSLTLLETVERDTIVAAMHQAKWNKSLASEILGVGRTTLYDRLRRYRIARTASS